MLKAGAGAAADAGAAAAVTVHMATSPARAPAAAIRIRTDPTSLICGLPESLWLVTFRRLLAQWAARIQMPPWLRDWRRAGVCEERLEEAQGTLRHEIKVLRSRDRRSEEGIQILADPAPGERRDCHHTAQGAARRKIEEAGAAIGRVSPAD